MPQQQADPHPAYCRTLPPIQMKKTMTMMSQEVGTMMSCFILKPFELLEQCTFGVALAQNAFQRFKTSSDLNGTVGTPHFVAGHIYIYIYMQKTLSNGSKA